MQVLTDLVTTVLASLIHNWLALSLAVVVGDFSWEGHMSRSLQVSCSGR